MKWLLFTSLFPSRVSPDNGLFNLARVNALREKGQEVVAVVPIDLTPHMRYLWKNRNGNALRKHWLDRYHVPAEETIENIHVYHPRWYSPPRSQFWKHEHKWLHWQCGKEIDRIIKIEKPDVIVCSWLSPFGVYAKYLNIPVLVIPEGDDLLLYPDMYPGWNDLRTILNRDCERIICSSQYMFDTAFNKRGLLPLIQIQNGYDHKTYQNNGEYTNETGKINLLCVGYLDHVKGQDILVQAMVKLDERFELTLVGNGTLKSELENMVHALGLQKRVHFAGFQPPAKLSAYYQAADIFCLASRSEGFGISILEAMACGLPIVASDAGGIPEKIVNGRNGFIARKDDVDDFVAQIRKAAETQWDSKQIADAVSEKYGWERWASQMIELIENSRQGS